MIDSDFNRVPGDTELDPVIIHQFAKTLGPLTAVPGIGKGEVEIEGPDALKLASVMMKAARAGYPYDRFRYSGNSAIWKGSLQELMDHVAHRFRLDITPERTFHGYDY